MKKFCYIILTILLTVSVLPAAGFHSVPLSSEAYRIIDAGEERGIIEVQSDVKPYNLNTVRKLLCEIRSSNGITASEAEAIDRTLLEFDSLYGKDPDSPSAEGASSSTSLRIGAVLSSVQKAGAVFGSDWIFDSRNSGSVYAMGDILGAVSYDLNVRFNVDRIDTKAYLPSELLISTDGFYMGKYYSSARLEKLPDEHFFFGVETFPEMSASIRDDIVQIRMGAVKRDWGPGRNNLSLSGSSRVFEGMELSLKPTSWFSYSVLTGSLGQTSLESVNGIEWPSENMSAKNGKYYNNISIHRAELSYKGIKAAVWESVIWRKRFELMYLNPLSIYMLAQNALGDYDNCLLGADISYTWKGVGTFYIAGAADELDSFSNALVWPRNIISCQAGAKFSLPFFSFTQLTVQGTYVPAFFGAHYQDKAEIFGNVEYTTAYVNKGQTLSYPVNPDTMEFLLALDTTVSDWKIGILVKDQMRSAQYASKKTGTDILTFMDYSACNSGEYVNRDFFGNIWNNILDMELSVEKKVWNVTFTGALQGVLTTERDFTPEVHTSSDGFAYNPGRVTAWGEWNSSFSLIVTFGARVVF